MMCLELNLKGIENNILAVYFMKFTYSYFNCNPKLTLKNIEKSKCYKKLIYFLSKQQLMVYQIPQVKIHKKSFQ